MIRRHVVRDSRGVRMERGSRRSRPVAFRTALATIVAAVVAATGGATPSTVTRELSSAMSAGSDPFAITAGPDGNLLFTEYEGNRIGRITPTGVVTEFSAGISPGSGPNGIAAGPDGNLWFTERGGDRVGRITPQGVISEYPPTAAIRGVRLPRTRSVSVRVRCPSGAARECRGTLRLLIPPATRVGVKAFAVAPGRRAEVVVPLWAAGRLQLRAQRKLSLSVVLVPSAHSLAGSVERGVVLRLPRLPAVTG